MLKSLAPKVSAKIHNANNIDHLRAMPPNSVHSIVTDPPYGLNSSTDIGKILTAWLDNKDIKGKGFMGMSWDSCVPSPAFWQEALRVLKPGGFVLSFFAAKTQDLGTLAMRLGGFGIKTSLIWCYGSGFPKGLDVGKAMQSATDAEQWQGWATELKPAFEPIVLAQKPIEKGISIAENILRHRTGAMNINACRIPTNDKVNRLNRKGAIRHNGIYNNGSVYLNSAENLFSLHPNGRFPANVLHDGSDEALSLFSSDSCNYEQSPARFFYCAKPSPKEQNAGLGASKANSHPTVKPLELVRYLVRLITPPNGTVLDPFMGSGTTGCAAVLEGFNFIGVDIEEKYCTMAEKRIAYYLQ